MRRRGAVLTMTAGAALAGLTFATVSGNAAVATGSHHRVAASAAARPPYGEIVVSDNTNIFVFAPGANGNVAPIRTITTGLGASYPVRLDPHGNIWVEDFDANKLEEFAAMAHGSATPIRTITTPSSSNLSEPDGLALTSDGSRAWVGNDMAPTLTQFSTSAHGSVSPTQRIAGSKTRISRSHAIALTPDGRHLWQEDASTNNLQEFTTSGPANRAPIRKITEGDISTHYVEGIAVDLAGNVWASDNDSNQILEYGPGSNSVPIRTITGNTANFYISIDVAGKLWVAGGGDPAYVEEYSPTANGNATPLRKITGPATGLSGAVDVAVYGARPSAPRSVKAHAGKHKVSLRWHAPADNGGGLAAYLVQRKNSKHAHWAAIAVTKKRRIADRHRKAHHRYRYRVIAVNQMGFSPASKTASAVTPGAKHH